MGLLLDGGNIRAIARQPRLRFRNLPGESLADAVLQGIPLAQVVCFEQFQLGHLNVQIHLLFDHGVAAGQRLDLGVR